MKNGHHSPILEHLRELHRELSQVAEGDLPTYIPELAKANPHWFGICVVTTSGGVYEVGDSSQEFTIQSISKPFVYGLALEDRGRAEIKTKVGVEPTGEAFNSISLDPATGRPRNPMINAGAIAITGLVEGKTPATRLKRMMEMLERYAGRELLVDDTVYRSESRTGHRNRAIGHMLRNFEILTEDPMPVVEVYFHQCSVSVTCRDLAVMAATLANRGLNPLTGQQALRGEYVEDVLGVMGTCGMYDYAGEWLYNVGLPAKSGVAGGVIAVSPGQLGIGVFSPLLDPHGNSVRGIRTCEALSRHLNLHLFSRPAVGKGAIRVQSTVDEFSSNRVRTEAEFHVLHRFGSRIRLYQLQGNLTFVAVEVVVRELFEHADAVESLVLDFKRVLTVNESACRLFSDLLCEFGEAGRPVVFVHTESLPGLRRHMKARLGDSFEERFQVFPETDSALEWCENRLLERMSAAEPLPEVSDLGEYSLLAGLTLGERQTVAGLLRRETWQAGEVIIQIGAEADALFLLARGKVSVMAALEAGRCKRLATFSPGMVFGEMAVLDQAPRSATIVADSEVECDLLSCGDFEALGECAPHIKIKLLENLARGLSTRLRKANREITIFE